MKLKYGINVCTNREYHGDKSFLSSSSLKTINKSPRKFYEEHFLGEKKQLKGAFLDEGTLTHSLILEPETVEQEFAFFEGMRKAGKEWEVFKAEHEGKLLMSKPQQERCEAYVEAYKQRKEAVILIQGGLPEHTVCAALNGIDIKVRCDYINIDKGYIVDVKTTAFPSDRDSFAMTIEQYEYDLSAALYLRIVEEYYQKPFQFYFLVIGKKDLTCELFKLSMRSRHKGNQKILKALRTYKKCLQTDVWHATVREEHDVINGSNYEILEV